MEDGSYAAVTDSSSNPLMRLLDEGMSDVKKYLDEMKKLTELMEDEGTSVEDRYATQMKLADLEGELEKELFTLQEKLLEASKAEAIPVMGGPISMEAQVDLLDLMERTKKGEAVDLEPLYLIDRETGELLSFTNPFVNRSTYAEFVDKKTELKKETIQRVYMREHDPEAWAEHEEKLRKAYREEFEAKEAMMDPYKDMALRNLLEEDRGVVVDPETGETTFPLKPGSDIPGSIAVDLEQIANTPPPEDAGVILHRPMLDSDLHYEYQMEKYVEDRLAELEKGDYEELNASRVSVLSSVLAEESSDFFEDMTNQLTEQFQKFAAASELVGAEDPAQEPDDERTRQIQEIVDLTMDFLKWTLLAGIQNNTVREPGTSYNYKAKPSDDPMNGVRDIFAPVYTTPLEYWQNHRPDLFQRGNAEA